MEREAPGFRGLLLLYGLELWELFVVYTIAGTLIGGAGSYWSPSEWLAAVS